MNVTYRRATVEDGEAIWRVRTDAIREGCKAHYGESEVRAWSAVAMPETFPDAIRTTDFLVAEQDGAIVAFGFLNRATSRIEALFVSPEASGRGIGKATLTALERIAREHGTSSLALSASLNAVAFYQAAGYQIVEETTWRHPSGFDLACVHMEKSLSETSPPRIT